MARPTRYYTVGGIIFSQAELARALGLPACTLLRRLRAGWPWSRIVQTPAQPRQRERLLRALVARQQGGF